MTKDRDKIILKDLNESESDSDDFDEDEDSGCSFMSILSTMFILSVLFILVTLIFYRESRPEELKNVFEPVDKYLNVPQTYLNDFIINLKNLINSKEGGKGHQQAEELKNKRWDNQQVEIDLIKLRIENENKIQSESEAKAKDENFDEEIKFWKFEIENIEKEIEKSKSERKLMQLPDLKSLLMSMSSLNEEVNERMKQIKESDFMPLNVDEMIKEVYEILFKNAVVKSFIDDLAGRRGKIREVLKYGDQTSFFRNYKEKYFYNWLMKNKDNNQFTSEIKLKSIQDLEKKAKEVYEEFYKNFKVDKPENVAIEFDKVMRVEKNATIITTTTKELQELEKSLFILLSKDLNFYGKLVDLLNLKTSSMDFINEFQVILKGNFEHYETLFKRLEKRISSQEQRIKKNAVVKSIDVNSVLLECWHKRNLLNLFTDRRLTTFDQFRFNEIKTIYEYSEKFNIWFKEKLLLLPHEETEKDLKKKIEKKSNSKSVVDVKVIEEFNDLDRILTRKLSIFDHSPYEFALDRVFRDYNKFNPTKAFNVPGHFIYYTEAYLFTAAAHYSTIMRTGTKELQGIREAWPKAVSDDRSFLDDEEAYKRTVVSRVNSKNWNGPVPESYEDLMIVEKPVEEKPKRREANHLDIFKANNRITGKVIDALF